MNAINKRGYQDVPMTRRRAQLLAEYANKLAEMLENAPNNQDLAEWVQSKIDRAADQIQSAYHYLDQEDDDDLEKAVGHKYTHRKRVGTDKRGRARYRYYYAEHQGGGISRASFEAGSAFKLTWKGRRGHFHIDRVEGDQVFITHDSRPSMTPVAISKGELRALLKSQHGKAEQEHVEKRRKEVEKIKSKGVKRGLGLALHRLRQAAQVAGVQLDERYQQPKKEKPTQVTGTPSADNFETMPEVETTPRNELTETAQQIIEEANQEHEERHDEHQEITKFELGEHTHTKTGAKLYTAKQKERTDRDEYFRRVEIAKKHGGRYESRYVKGFVFKNAEDARAFALEVEGAAQTPKSAETVTPHEDHPSADNFETMPEVESAGTPKRTVTDELNDIDSSLFKELVLSNVPKDTKNTLEDLFSQDAPYVPKEEEKIIPSWYTREVARALAILRQSISSKGERTGLGSLLTQSQITQLREILRPIAEAHSERDYKAAAESMAPMALHYLVHYSSLSKQFYDLAEGLIHYAATRDKETTSETYADYVEWTNTDVQEHIKRLITQTPPEQHARLWSEIINPQLREIKKKGKVRDTPLTRAFKAEGWTPQGFFRRKDGEVVQLEIIKGEPIRSDYEFKADRQGQLLARTRFKHYSVTHGNYIEYGKWKPAAELLTPVGLGYEEGSIERILKRSKGDSLGAQRQMIAALIKRIPSEIKETHKVWINQNGTEIRLYAKGRGREQDLSVNVKDGEYEVKHTKRGAEFWQTIQGELNKLLSDAPAQTPTPPQPPTTPREQLTETAREVIQGADNFDMISDEHKELIRNKTREFSEELMHGLIYDTTKRGKIKSLRGQLSGDVENALRKMALSALRGDDLIDVSLKRIIISDIANENRRGRISELLSVGDTVEDKQDALYKQALIEVADHIDEKAQSLADSEIMMQAEHSAVKQRTAYLRALSAEIETEQPAPTPSPAREQLAETVRELTAPSSPLNIDQANAQDTLTEDRTRSAESKAADKALIESARELAKTSERGEEIKSALVDLMNAQQLKRYKRATGEMSARAEDMIEKRRQARERLRAATSGEVIDARLDRDLARDARETAKQEAREAQEARQYQKQTFTPEIQSAIESLKSRHFATKGKSYPLETYLKTRKDGGIYKTTETPAELADRIAENLPDTLANLYDFGEDTLRALITKAINEGVEARETPAELKDRIGAVITKRFRDNAASQKAQITGEGQREALIEMKRNIKKLLGDGFFNENRRRGERSYMGLGAIEKTLDMSERLSDLYVDGIFAQALPPELERFKLPVTRFGRKAADEVAGAFANKYETVGEIRDNISTIKEQMRATIKRALDQTTDALVKRPTTLDLINQSYEKATERLNTDRQKNIENARALAQYTDNPQAHLAEIQELERQSDQAIAEQMEINREFASAYIHEASDLAERALETTKGEVIDNVMKVKTPLHANKFTATERGTANRKLMARIFNQVFEQVRREIGDEPIERGEKHPRNIADTVKKPSKTPAQFREDIDRAERDARERLAERWGRITRKSANHMINYRAQLLQTIERIA